MIFIGYNIYISADRYYNHKWHCRYAGIYAGDYKGAIKMKCPLCDYMTSLQANEDLAEHLAFAHRYELFNKETQSIPKKILKRAKKIRRRLK